MTIALYARVSTGSDEQLNALDQQEARLKKAAADAGCTNPRWYRDIQTGTKEERAAFDRMMDDCKAGLITKVVVTRVDRLSRHGIQQAKVVHYFGQSHTPDLKILDLPVDVSDDWGALIASIIGAVAVSEVKMLASRVRWGHARRRELKKVFGYKAPFGYRKTPEGYLEPDPDQWPVAKEIIRRFKENPQWRPIVTWLHEEKGLHQFSNAYSLRRWMLNPTLCGARAYGTRKQVVDRETGDADLVMRGPGNYGEIHWEDEEGQPFQEPLWSVVEWAWAVSVAKERSTPANRQHAKGSGGAIVLTGLVRCADCGKNLQRHASGKKSPRLKMRCTTPGCVSRYKTLDCRLVETKLAELMGDHADNITKDLLTFQRARESKVSQQEQELRDEIQELTLKAEEKPRYRTALEDARQELNALLKSENTGFDVEHFLGMSRKLRSLLEEGGVFTNESPELLRSLLQRYCRMEASMGALTKVVLVDQLRAPGSDGVIDLTGQNIGRTPALQLEGTLRGYCEAIEFKAMTSDQKLQLVQKLRLMAMQQHDGEKFSAGVEEERAHLELLLGLDRAELMEWAEVECEIRKPDSWNRSITVPEESWRKLEEFLAKRAAEETQKGEAWVEFFSYRGKAIGE